MITRKHLLLAIAVTCLLTIFLITIVPIRSQTAGQYDPWLDYNDDGKIDGRDIAPAARAFGTFGDPTKDVNVTNWPTGLSSGNVNVTNWPSQYAILTLLGPPLNISLNTGGVGVAFGGFNVAGFSRMTVLVQVLQVFPPDYRDINITLFNISWSLDSNSLERGIYWEDFRGNEPVLWTQASYGSFANNTFETRAPYAGLQLNIYSSYMPGWIEFNVYLYMRNE